MRQQCAALIVSLTSLTLLDACAGAHTTREKQWAIFNDCLTENWAVLEDWTSEAPAVARGIALTCGEEYSAWVAAHPYGVRPYGAAGLVDIALITVLEIVQVRAVACCR